MTSAVGFQRSAITIGAGFLAVAIAFESFSYWVGTTVSHDLGDVVVPLKQHWIESGRAKTDIAVLGDSFVKSGIEPAAIREVTGRTAINLGTNIFVTLYGQRLMLIRLLEAHRPKVLVFLTDTISFRQDISRDEDHYYLAKEFTRPGEILHLYRETGSASILLSQTFNLIFPLPSLYYRNVVQGALGAVLRALPRRDWAALQMPGYSVEKAVRAFEENDGMFPLEGDPIGFDLQDEPPFTSNPEMVAELRRIFDLCRSAKLPLAFGLNPIPQSVSAWRKDHDFDAGLPDIVQALRMDYPEILFLDPLIPVYPDADFYDRRHLFPEASRRHSAWLGRRILPLLDPP